MTYEIFTYSSSLVLLVNVILYFNGFVLLNKPIKIFSIYLLFLLIIDVISKYYFWNKIPNIFLSHYYIGIQFIILNIFFYYVSKSTLIRRAVKFLFPIVSIVIIFQYVFYITDLSKFNVMGIVITQLVIIFYYILYFFRSLNLILKIGNSIIFGLLVYMLGSTIFFSSGNFLSKNMPSLHKALWIGNSALYLFFQVLILIEWWKNFSQKKTK